MSDSEAEVEPKVVEYDPITGVPSEFNEFLPHDCAEWKKWKAALESGLEGAMAELEVKEKTQDGEEIEKKLPGGKVKKKAKPEIVLERNVRNKRKCVTTVTGLDIFKVTFCGVPRLLCLGGIIPGGTRQQPLWG